MIHILNKMGNKLFKKEIDILDVESNSDMFNKFEISIKLYNDDNNKILNDDIFSDFITFIKDNKMNDFYEKYKNCDEDKKNKIINNFIIFLLKTNNIDLIKLLIQDYNILKQIKIISSIINNIFENINLSTKENILLLDVFSKYLLEKCQNYNLTNENNLSEELESIEKILQLNNSFDIISKPINYIFQNYDKLTENNGYFSFKRNSECLEDLIKLGRYNDAIKFYHKFHYLGKNCNFHCNCDTHLIKLQNWDLLFNHYNNHSSEFVQSEKFINLVEYFNMYNVSKTELHNLSKYIVNEINKDIFKKKIDGDNITPEYKYNLSGSDKPKVLCSLSRNYGGRNVRLD